MDNSKLISVIIPVYNIKGFLRRCIHSVINQSYTNLEIILVDDGSTDGSEKICDSFSRKDLRIRVIHKKNGGLSSARNAAINVSNGAYLFFLDGDDFVDRNCLQNLYENLLFFNTDMSVCSYYYYTKQKVKKFGTQSIKTILTKEEAINIIGRGREFTASAWGKLYKKELFYNLRYPNNKLCEDQFVMYDILLRCHSVYFNSDPLYFYTIRENSIMNSKSAIQMSDVIDAARRNYNLINDSFPNLKYISVYRVVEAYLEVINRMNNSDMYNFHNNKIMKQCQKFLFLNRNYIFMDRENMYFFIQKIYCFFILLNPKMFIRIHNLYKKIRGG